MVYANDLFSLPRLDEPAAGRMSSDRVFSVSDRERRCETSECLTRSQVMDRIIRINTTATELYLSQFGDDALRTYLDHLTTACGRRGRETRWERRAESPAVVGGVVAC